MKKLSFLICILCVLKLNAQDYLISFAGTGASTSVSTVKVENLDLGTSLTLNGNDILHLTGLTRINTIENNQSMGLKIYPNPMTNNSILQITPSVSGIATISMFDMAGKSVAKIQSYLESGLQEFSISGLYSGFYLISVKGNGYQYSGKLLCNSYESGLINVEKLSSNKAVNLKTIKNDTKGVFNAIDMDYNDGNRLEFTGISGNYSTIIMDVPESSKTITFNFIACMDGDNNHYPVVEIGTQIWMAENLKTTSYNDETSIPEVTNNTDWENLTTPAYCWYDNDETTYKASRGALYNWYTVNTGNLCPQGWRVPSDADWHTLALYLDPNAILDTFESVTAGGKLKETGTTHWKSPNTGATNETGFSAVPGGYRDSGVFGSISDVGNWWSSTVQEGDNVFYRAMDTNTSNLLMLYHPKTCGFSDRCLKDD